MERKIKRQKVLPSFSIDVAQLELLISKVTTEFSCDDRLNVSITVHLPLTELSFKSIDELRDCTELPSQITKLDLYIASKNKTMLILSNYLGLYSVHATSDSEAWCAGIIEIVNSTAMLNKRFYSAVNKVDTFWALFAFVMILALVIFIDSLTNFIPEGYTVSIYNIIGFLISVCLIIYIKHKHFPPFVLRINNSSNIIKRYSDEIMAIGTVIIALGTIFMAISPST